MFGNPQGAAPNSAITVKKKSQILTLDPNVPQLTHAKNHVELLAWKEDMDFTDNGNDMLKDRSPQQEEHIVESLGECFLQRFHQFPDCGNWFIFNLLGHCLSIVQQTTVTNSVWSFAHSWSFSRDRLLHRGFARAITILHNNVEPPCDWLSQGRNVSFEGRQH